ncbi:MAG: tRNA (adenosine(37)-N6)-dimethylallyltransferase MiaA [Leeuwenhoekiella sp.]
MTKTVIVVVGTTAIGKTALAIQLAQIFNAEIISADSRQFFKEMKIGTAVPSDDELAAAKHHFIQHLSIHEPYSVGDFERDALRKIEELHQKSDYVIVAGGSGLYVNSLLYGLDDFPKIDPSVRERLIKEHETKGISHLQKKLIALDPVQAKKVDLQNSQRIIRALEVCLATGKPYSQFLSKKTVKRPFNIIKIGLSAPREIIYDRINRRVDTMVERGLLEEARTLFRHRKLNALNTVGYKELFNYLNGSLSKEEAIEKIKINTRRFAKRQLTWYRKEENIHWFPYDTASEDIGDFIKKETTTSS